MTDSTQARQRWLGLMARAPQTRVAALLDSLGARPDFTWLRKPEVGTVMVRGRAGGTGAPFNLSEMTVTRAALQLETGEVGHGHVAGRSKSDAEAVALTDALLQTHRAAQVQEAVITPLAEAEATARAARAAKAAATKVEFFTMVRGED